ncbi:MAG: adenosine deaminase family protein [Piscinibacter sp.]|nr:adenosine deaminase family protein [Piscinibacter sp.]
MPDPARQTTADRTRALPKVLLHEHLDGSLRVATLLELLHARGLDAPAGDPDALESWFADRAHAGSLVEYLRGFALTVAAMASLPAMERVAFEAAEDARADGTVLAEFRIAPLLFEPFGIAPEAAVEALLAGLARSALPSGLILCAMRHEPADRSERVAALAARYLGRGVVAFDLAGAEAGHPPSDHARAIGLAREAGVGLTLHAGEADAGDRVLEAARLGASRIGHGVRVVDLLRTARRDAVLDELRERGVHLEVCPTSNVHTGAAASVAAHPIVPLWRAGVNLSYHTDNRLMSQVTHGSEAKALLDEAGLTEADLLRMGELALSASFLGETAKAPARAAFAAWPAA